jgi:TatD DNase family protein
MTNAPAEPSFVDTHAHLDDDAFAGEADAAIERAAAGGVARIVNIGYRPAIWRSTIELAQKHAAIRFTLGLHPNHANEDANPIWLELRRLINETRPIAIGEIGLDYFRDYALKATQLRVFGRQLDLAAEFQLPVVIHQREAEDDLRAVLRERRGQVPWILHSFDGSQELADEALAAGCYFGVGGLMTRAGSAGLREILKSVPLDRLLLETDSPYLVPKGVKNRRNEPANIPLIAESLAALLERPLGEIARQTTANAERVFGPLGVGLT